MRRLHAFAEQAATQLTSGHSDPTRGLSRRGFLFMLSAIGLIVETSYGQAIVRVAGVDGSSMQQRHAVTGSLRAVKRGNGAGCFLSSLMIQESAGQLVRDIALAIMVAVRVSDRTGK